MTDIVEVKVDELIEDLSIYPRGGIGGPHVTRLVDALAAGEVLPPIKVDEPSKRIVDGWHRVRAYKRLKRKAIPAVLKSYPSEADLFADAAASNFTHGLALDPYDVRRAVIRLIEYGWTPRKITGTLHLTEARVLEIKKQSATNIDNEPVAVKAGAMHLVGTRLTRKQERAMESYGGMPATFYARQLLLGLDAKIVNPTPVLIALMDELVQAWRAYKQNLAS